MSSKASQPRFGYTLYCEGNPPKSLVEQAVMAEQAGFDFLVISDHYHPWLTEQQHSAFAWSVLGAVAQATERIELATMVTCPIIRYHPAVVAQMAATVAVLSDERFTLGLGAGERLNEHVVGRGWPPVSVRHEMLREAIGIMRELWEGGYVSHRGRHFTVEDARVFDLPAKPIETYVAAGGPQAAALAAETADGVCATEPDEDLIRAYLDAGGQAGHTWGQVVLAWAPEEDRGLREAHAQFRFASGGWKVQSELPNPVNFDAATQTVEPSDLAEVIPAGPDPEAHAEAIQGYLDAGFNRIAVAYPGADARSFMDFWVDALRPTL
ncbi:MAG: TIGR03557 family F420-dependent LLM class oxidoreductase [Gaiellales bacterium]